MGSFFRFVAKIKFTDTCWLWTGAHNARGYGHFASKEHKTRQAHRIAYEMWREMIPPGLEIDHLCRTPGCVNPWHLEPVTHAENVRRGTAAAVNAARQMAKTHCPWGHGYTPDNIYWENGKRHCKTCQKARARKIWREKKARLGIRDKTRERCPHGHEYNEANTYYRKDTNGRQCRVCDKERQHARRETRRDAT